MKPLTPTPDAKRAQMQDLMWLLKDERPHTAQELARVSLSYRQRVSDLRKLGYRIVCEPGIGGVNFYRYLGTGQMALPLKK